MGGRPMALAVVIVVAGIAGPRWSGMATPLRFIAGIAIGIMSWALFVAGVVGLGSLLTPFPRGPRNAHCATGRTGVRVG